MVNNIKQSLLLCFPVNAFVLLPRFVLLAACTPSGIVREQGWGKKLSSKQIPDFGISMQNKKRNREAKVQCLRKLAVFPRYYCRKAPLFDTCID